MTYLRKLGSALVIAGGLALASAPAYAVAILNFGGNGQNTATLNNNGAGVSTLTVTAGPITISFIENVGPTSIAAFFDLSATSQGNAVTSLGNVAQIFGGSFCVSSVAGCGGIIYLQSAVSFVDTSGGTVGGGQLVMGVSQPPDTLAFSQSGGPITSLGVGTAMALSFTAGSQALAAAGVGPSLGAVGNTTYQISGNFSANNPVQVPEPASLLLLGAGLAGLGFSRRKKQLPA